MKILIDILTITIFTVGIITTIEWLLNLPGKLFRLYYDKFHKPKK